MEFKKKHIYGIAAGIIIFVFDFLMIKDSAFFVPLIVISIAVAASQFLLDFFVMSAKQKELERRFPEFVRNLVGAVKSGMPISKALVFVSKTDYGFLSPYVLKLANQVEWSIPVHKALLNFAKETENKVIIRSIATVIEAELSGGSIEDVLESVTTSVIEIKKIKDQRRASIHSQIVQSYIIFIVFLVVMIVIQNLLIPYIARMETGESGIGGAGITGAATGIVRTSALEDVMRDVSFDFSSLGAFFDSFFNWVTSLKATFLMLAVIQGAFAGVVLGKLAEGDLRSGLKHSIILVLLAFVVITLAQGALTY